jgi:hypothetical protein
MWARSKDANDASKFEVTVWDNTGNVFFHQGGFATFQDADRAAEIEQRNALFGKQEEIDWDMTDDELLDLLRA